MKTTKYRLLLIIGYVIGMVVGVEGYEGPEDGVDNLNLPIERAISLKIELAKTFQKLENLKDGSEIEGESMKEYKVRWFELFIRLHKLTIGYTYWALNEFNEGLIHLNEEEGGLREIRELDMNKAREVLGKKLERIAGTVYWLQRLFPEVYDIYEEDRGGENYYTMDGRGYYNCLDGVEKIASRIVDRWGETVDSEFFGQLVILSGVIEDSLNYLDDLEEMVYEYELGGEVLKI